MTFWFFLVLLLLLLEGDLGEAIGQNVSIGKMFFVRKI